MKRFVLLPALCALAGLLLSGCEEKPAPPKPVKKVVKAKPAPKQKPVKQAKTAQPGTLDYLDAKYGFRDVNFGMPMTALDNLTPAGEDTNRNLKIFTRTGDELTFGNIPLQKIEYSFYEDKLAQVSARWSIEHKDSAIRVPPMTEVSAFCATLYGHPTRHSTTKDSTFYVWHGKKAVVLITETRMAGVPDTVKGGWAVPPTTSGQMMIYSLPLQRTANATVASQTAQNSGGL